MGGGEGSFVGTLVCLPSRPDTTREGVPGLGAVGAPPGPPLPVHLPNEQEREVAGVGLLRPQDTLRSGRRVGDDPPSAVAWKSLAIGPDRGRAFADAIINSTELMNGRTFFGKYLCAVGENPDMADITVSAMSRGLAKEPSSLSGGWGLRPRPPTAAHTRRCGKPRWWALQPPRSYKSADL